jgi:hypothetical protein
VNINPELQLAAAQRARPEFSITLTNDGRLYARNKSEGIEGKEFPLSFSAMHFESDYKRLLLALMKDGWGFMWSESHNTHEAFHKFPGHKSGKPWYDSQFDEYDGRLLYKCVSAQTSIPMSVDTGGG